jgi:hypothetical protein
MSTPASCLGADGSCVYFGPNGAPAIEFFTSTSGLFKKPYSTHDNEAEWIVDNITAAGKEGCAKECREAYLQSDLRSRNLAELDQKLASMSLDSLPAAMRKDLSSSSTVASVADVSLFFGAIITLFKYRYPIQMSTGPMAFGFVAKDAVRYHTSGALLCAFPLTSSVSLR